MMLIDRTISIPSACVCEIPSNGSLEKGFATCEEKEKKKVLKSNNDDNNFGLIKSRQPAIFYCNESIL